MTSPPDEKRRPPAGKAAHSELQGNDPNIQPIGLTRIGTGRRYWARRLIDRSSSDRPEYGSTAWLMLPDDHPDKIAACVVAAECWAYSADNLEDDLRREIEAFQMGFKHGEDAEYQRQVREHRKTFGNPPSQMRSFLERRAAQLAAAAPRPDDYKGGPVEWGKGDGA